MTTFVLATHNAGKLAELRRILGDRLGPHELVGYDGPAPVEDGDTFEANALIKARAATAHTGLPALADDSGIAVDALGGAPGIFSARYSQLAGGDKSDAANNASDATRVMPRCARHQSRLRAYQLRSHSKILFVRSFTPPRSPTAHNTGMTVSVRKREPSSA